MKLFNKDRYDKNNVGAKIKRENSEKEMPVEKFTVKKKNAKWLLRILYELK